MMVVSDFEEMLGRNGNHYTFLRIERVDLVKKELCRQWIL